MPVPVRKNVYSLSSAEFGRYVQGVKALKANGQYDNLIRAHFSVIPQVHGTPMFLPWHRAFLMDFEAKMRTALGDPTYAIPYWDWTDDAKYPSHKGLLWDPQRMGQGNPVNTGPFANVQGQPPQWVTISPNNQFGPNLQRGLTADGSDPQIQYTDRAAAVACFSKANMAYDAFRVAVEFGPHGNMHRWVGGESGGQSIGQMDSVENSVNDPVFFMHHANVDRMWAEWQELYPNSPVSAPNFGWETLMPATSPGSPRKLVGDVVQIIGTVYRYDLSYVTRMICAHPGKDSDPPLYYSVFGDNTQSWPADRQFENGNQGQASVGLANFNGDLFCVHRGYRDDQLWWTTYNSNSGWAEDQQFSNDNQSVYGPGIFVFHNTLHCVHAGRQGDSSLYWTSYNGSNWATDVQFNGNEGRDSPGLTTVGGTMVCLHRGSGMDEQIYWSVFDYNKNTWSGDTQIFSGSQARDGIGVVILCGKIYCVHSGNVGSPNMWWTMYNGNWGWNQDTQFSNGNCCSGTPGLVVHNGLLYCAHRGYGYNDDTLWWCVFDPTTQTWTQDTQFGNGSRTAAGCALGIYALNG